MSARLEAEIEGLRAELELTRLALLAVDHGAQPPTIEVLRRFLGTPPYPIVERCRRVSDSFAADGVTISPLAVRRRVRRLNAKRYGTNRDRMQSQVIVNASSNPTG